MKKFLCNCGKIAVWSYAPATSNKRNPYYCDDCVPRGCSCNDEYEDDDPQYGQKITDVIKWMEGRGNKWKWKEEGIDFNSIDIFDAWVVKNIEKIHVPPEEYCRIHRTSQGQTVLQRD